MSRPLVKKPLPEIPPNNDGKVLARIGLFALIAFCLWGIIAFLSSCTTVKKAYEKAAESIPQTKQDSANALKIAKNILGESKTKTVFKPGATVRVPVKVPVKVLDTLELERISDSLQIAHNSDLNDAIDDCMASVNKARKDGIKAGYDKAMKERPDSIDKQLPDTVLAPDPATELALQKTQFELRNAQSDLIKSNAEKAIYKKESADKNWWIVILLIILIGSHAGLIVWRIKRKIPFI